MHFTHLGFDVQIRQNTYSQGGRLALSLIAAATERNRRQDCARGEPMGTLTVNMPEVDLGPNEVIVKTWAENEGILKNCPDGLFTPIRQITADQTTAQIASVNHKILALYTQPEDTPMPKPAKNDPAQPELPLDAARCITLTIPAGHMIRIEPVAATIPAPAASPIPAAPQPMTPERFATGILRAYAEMTPQQIHDGLSLAVEKGFTLPRLAAAVHGVLYEGFNRSVKRNREQGAGLPQGAALASAMHKRKAPHFPRQRKALTIPNHA